MYDDIEEKEKMTTTEFLVFMILCVAICLVGYIIGCAIISIFGG